jgi:hypothetical protein
MSTGTARVLKTNCGYSGKLRGTQDHWGLSGPVAWFRTCMECSGAAGSTQVQHRWSGPTGGTADQEWILWTSGLLLNSSMAQDQQG